MKINKKKVTKERFDKFIEEYPSPLVIDVCGIFEPPIKSYNDFAKGDFPDSVVAFIHLEEVYGGENEYYLTKDL